MKRLRARGRALPLLSQDAHGQGCQCGHCLHLFCVGPWHPGCPGIRTRSQALHAAPVFTCSKKQSQKGLGKQAHPPSHATRPKLIEGWTSQTKGPTADRSGSLLSQGSMLSVQPSVPSWSPPPQPARKSRADSLWPPGGPSRCPSHSPTPDPFS